MDLYLRMHPEYKERAELLEKIRNKTVYEHVGNISEHCNVLDIAGLKELMNEAQPKRREELQRIVKRMGNKSQDGMESAVYRILSHKPVVFDDISTKIRFYKEFWEFRKYFRNGSVDPFFTLAELLYLRVYRRKEVSSLVAKNLLKLPFLEKVFYFMFFADFLTTETITEITRNILSGEVNDPYFDYKVIAMSCLPDHLRYKPLAVHVLYSADIEKVKIILKLSSTISIERLAMAMMSECFSSTLGINIFYLKYLQILSMFPLNRSFRLKILYGWMRYFLIHRMAEHFTLLFERVKAMGVKDDELHLYELFNKYLNGSLEFGIIKGCIKDFKDENACALHSVDEIIKVYANG